MPGVDQSSAQWIGNFAEDGAICVRGALGHDEVQVLDAMFTHAIEHKGPRASYRYSEGDALFFADSFNKQQWPQYRPAYEDTTVPDLVARVIACKDIWFFYEQIIWKTGGETLSTPWHQDTYYVPTVGDQQAVVWIPLTSVSEEESLQFVRGSHKGPTYDPSSIDPEDIDRTTSDKVASPRPPGIPGDGVFVDVMSWALDPGDVAVFHPGTLHGGAPTHSGAERRTISLRYFGSDAVFSPHLVEAGDKHVVSTRPGEDPMADAFAHLAPGSALFSSDLWPKVRDELR